MVSATVSMLTGGDRKYILPEDKYNATNFLTLVDFEGLFKYSPLFYGWYTSRDLSINNSYRLPFAYFVTGLVVYGYSFFATLRKMAENSRMSKLSEKDDECIFSWKLFTGWDYMIGNAETAHNRMASIVMGFKEALLEEAEKKRESTNWRVIGFRILVNTIVLGLLSFSVQAVILVVKRSTEPEAKSTAWRTNEITFVMSFISTLFPMLFEGLGFLEQYHPRKQLRLQLARIMVLNLLQLYSLIFALFVKISHMTTELETLNRTDINTLASASSFNLLPTLHPFDLPIRCPEFGSQVLEGDENMFATKLAVTTIAATLSHQFVQKYKLSTTPGPDIIGAPSNKLSTSYDGSTTEPTNTFRSFDYYLSTGNYEDNFTEYMDTDNTTDIGNVDNTTTYYNGTTEYFNLTETEMYKNYSVNASFLENYEFNDVKDAFIDYLTFILFNIDTNATLFSSNINATNTTEDVFNMESTSEDTNYSYFKTTIAPFLSTFADTNETDFNLKFYNEISSTLSTFTNNVTSIRNFNNCSAIYRNESTEKYNISFNSLLNSWEVKEQVMNYTAKSRLRSLCWETMFGQELVKLTVMDLFLTIATSMCLDFFRGIFVRFMNKCWCWDLEKKFPNYGDFKVAENILHLVNNQGMVWMGMFFSPGLVVLNAIKLYILMYYRTWAVLSCNVPHEVIFRASRSNNFYYALLLMMLFLCVLPVGYAIVWIKPSWCGPFTRYERIFHIFTITIKNAVPEPLEKALDYIASPGIVIPLLVLLILIIYYLVSLTGALREANNDLKIQLRRERTEERRKMFQIADRRQRGGSGGSGELSNTPFGKWKKLLGSLPSGKSFDETPKFESEEMPKPLKQDTIENNRSKDFFSKLIKKALGKSSTSEEEINQNVDDATDNEQHESLPEDISIKDAHPKIHRPLKATASTGSTDFQKAVAAALSQKMKQKKLEKLRSSSDSNEIKHVQIQEYFPKHHIKTEKRDEKRNHTFKSKPIEKRSASRQDSGSSVWSDNIPVITISKTESAENILDELSTKPTIKHKYTEGTINQIDESIKNRKGKQLPPSNEEKRKFTPRIKYALKKQSTEIDEDTILHFNKDPDKERPLFSQIAFTAVSEENLTSEKLTGDESEPGPSTSFHDESLTDKSSSDTKESSQDTILNAPLAMDDSKDEDILESTTKSDPLIYNVSVDTQKSTSGTSSTQTESSTGYKDGTLS